MYEVWETCEKLIHHIEAVQDKYEELRSTGLDVQDMGWQILLADASWFVHFFPDSARLSGLAETSNAGFVVKLAP